MSIYLKYNPEIKQYSSTSNYYTTCSSSLIYKILVDAHDAGKQFCVIVADSRPRLEGKEQLRRLVKYGLDCSYMLINALSFVMPKVSNNENKSKKNL